MEQISYKNQNAALLKMFGVLPQITLGVIVFLRLIVAIPLFLSEKNNFSFFQSEILSTGIALTVVLALEIIGITASILTGYFRMIKLTVGFYFALSIALFIWAFTTYLIFNIENFEIKPSTQMVFQIFNTLGFALGEATGFLVISLSENEIDQSIDIRAEVLRLRAEGLTLQQIADAVGISITRVHRILNSPLKS